MNAWTYHYMNPDDYQYLDYLLVMDATMGDVGSFYIQAIADVDGMEQWRDPTLFYPGDAPEKLSLIDLLGPRNIWQEGKSIVRLNGNITIKFAEIYDRGAKLVISDAGLCGSSPHTLTVKVDWKGKREAIKELHVKTIERHEWTVADRIAHQRKIFRSSHQ